MATLRWWTQALAEGGRQTHFQPWSKSRRVSCVVQPPTCNGRVLVPNPACAGWCSLEIGVWQRVRTPAYTSFPAFYFHAPTQVHAHTRTRYGFTLCAASHKSFVLTLTCRCCWPVTLHRLQLFRFKAPLNDCHILPSFMRYRWNMALVANICTNIRKGLCLGRCNFFFFSFMCHGSSEINELI